MFIPFVILQFFNIKQIGTYIKRFNLSILLVFVKIWKKHKLLYLIEKVEAYQYKIILIVQLPE